MPPKYTSVTPGIKTDIVVKNLLHDLSLINTRLVKEDVKDMIDEADCLSLGL